MPKLNPKDRKKVAAAEATEERTYEPLPPGKYIATLEEVETRESQAGNEYWSATFSNIRGLDGEEHPGRLWYRLMLPIAKMPADYKPKSRPKPGESEDEWIARSWQTYQDLTAGRIKAFFEAFGYSLDSDTEEFYGQDAVVKVTITTQRQGRRAGEQVNDVSDVFALDTIEDLIEGDGGSKGKDDDEF